MTALEVCMEQFGLVSQSGVVGVVGLGEALLAISAPPGLEGNFKLFVLAS